MTFKIAATVFPRRIGCVVWLGHDFGSGQPRAGAVIIDTFTDGNTNTLICAVERQGAMHAVLVVRMIRTEEYQAIPTADLGVCHLPSILRHEVPLKSEDAAKPFDSCCWIPVPQRGENGIRWEHGHQHSKKTSKALEWRIALADEQRHARRNSLRCLRAGVGAGRVWLCEKTAPPVDGAAGGSRRVTVPGSGNPCGNRKRCRGGG